MLLSALYMFVSLSAIPPTAPTTTKPAAGKSRERIRWVRENAVRIQSIDPAHEDFADLAPLRTAIGDSRVVMLGEQTHGDGATFLAKVRLIKFLHREMGFSVLAWECGMNDCRRADELLRDDKVPVPDAVEAIFPLWARTAQVAPLWTYIRASHHAKQPLTVEGIDCQLTSRHSVENLAEAARHLFEKIQPSPLTEEIMQWEKSLQAYHLGKRYARTMAEAEKTEKETDTAALSRQLMAMVSLIESRREDLAKHASPAEVEFVRRAFLGAEYQVRLMHASVPGATADLVKLGSERDRLMGENLVFLANEFYPDRKLIVWCATMHALNDAPAVRNPFAFMPNPYKGVVTLGEVAKKKLGDDLYTIGFTAGRGSHGWYSDKEASPIPEVGRGSIEHYCRATKWPFLFIDFRGLLSKHWLRKPQLMRPLAYQYAKAVWPDQMDAVVYTEEMFRASMDELAPKSVKLTVESDQSRNRR